MLTNNKHHREILEQIAERAMFERGLLPDFSAAALAELDKITAPADIGREDAHDLRELLWVSIDNDDSRDLDQLTVAQAMSGDNVKIRVAVADVDALIKKGTSINAHARHNTTSVYTAAKIFPMLPEKLSTNLTSLNFNQDRLSLVIEMTIDSTGSLQDSNIYEAIVCNHAQLTYNGVAAWLESEAAAPEGVFSVPGLAENLRLQNLTAQKMKNYRHAHGALSFETIDSRPVFDGNQINHLAIEVKNQAKEIVENFMIAANGAVARFLSNSSFPSIRRVVRTPKRWQRIVELASKTGFKLPEEPDSKALENFLTQEKARDPIRFPDLSLTVIKLMGAGEYIAELPGDKHPDHFGLAVRDYTHATAPNRRYTDLITHRLVKAAISGMPLPYPIDELKALAKHCTTRENAANKVERQVSKSAVALLLESRIGEQFDALVTGASQKGTWVRLLKIPVEGKLVHGFGDLDVGDRVHVQLVSIDVERGFIDFKCVQ